MLSIQQMIKALRKLQNGGSLGELMKCLKHAAATPGNNQTISPALVTSLLSAQSGNGDNVTSSAAALPKQQEYQQRSPQNSDSSQLPQVNCQTTSVSLYSHLNENGSTSSSPSNTQDSNTPNTTVGAAVAANTHLQQRSQQIHNFYQQQLHHFHTQPNQSLCAKQKQIQFAMSSLAAEPLALKQEDMLANGSDCRTPDDARDETGAAASSMKGSSSSSAAEKSCFNTGLGEILQFMELIGNLKHTKRTGWVLRDVNDCESISGHMYRMSMMTFLLDGSEGLNQIRCMQLALVHDLAESLVGDITPFCGISKEEKRAMEFKAMEDICKLIEPRGKRIMELFEEYEHGQSAESKFVKDLDRLDMVMQAFEYEKRDNCLLKHQEFFDSTEGKFNHPFVKKLVNEIYEQRQILAKAKGATPPPAVHVPSMELPASNGHHCVDATPLKQEQKSSNSS